MYYNNTNVFSWVFCSDIDFFNDFNYTEWCLSEI